ncbi:MAG: tRNA preQ1(34) S-adenosylmethionine ribosyltransferase-isomerase QueA [Brevinematia bacterium]
MNIEEFDFELPEELIAYYPLKNRDKCRLLIIDRKNNSFHEGIFTDIKEYLKEGDILILNNSKVIKSRIFAKCKRTGREHEILITNLINKKSFTALVRNIKKLKIEDELITREFVFKIKDIKENIASLESNKEISLEEIEKIGQLPLPPYIEKIRKKLNLPIVTEIDEMFYQTVYSSIPGSIASPTAGLHFSEELIREIEEKGVTVKYITLHVGLGTFEPIRTKKVEEFKLKGEYAEVPKDVIESIIKSKEKKNKVVAVGTTVVRALETVFSDINKYKDGFKGITNIFIYPGYKFKVVDAMITNFHLPKSSLILLISAFAGKDLVMRAYKYAIENKFRFYSYGDATLII